MRARAAILLLAFVSGSAFADDPKPKVLDVKAIRDKLSVFEDPHGGIYVVYAGSETSEARLFYGPTNKTVYEQRIVAKGSNGETGGWSFGVWTPRMSGIDPAVVQRRDDGTFERWCGSDTKTPLKVIPADRAKPMLEKMQFNSTGIVRIAHLFARDDAGVYYYVDKLSKEYGGQGFRVFSGKKGAMKQLPLIDVASDTDGEVYSTKSGDMRFVVNATDHSKDVAYWIKGEKKHELVLLDLDMNSRVIYGELGLYPFLGTPCDEL